MPYTDTNGAEVTSYTPIPDPSMSVSSSAWTMAPLASLLAAILFFAALF